MTEFLAALRSLPLAARVALGVLLAVQLGLQLYGLRDLARRPRVPGGRKWPWALLIVLGNLVGAITYLALGRSAAGPEAGDEGRPDPAATRRAIDALYQDRPDA